MSKGSDACHEEIRLSEASARAKASRTSSKLHADLPLELAVNVCRSHAGRKSHEVPLCIVDLQAQDNAQHQQLEHFLLMASSALDMP